MNRKFPPRLTVGNRVWTAYGYPDHGPLHGPKVDIAPSMGGEIVGTEQAHPMMDAVLYTVRWDNGQVSKHYSQELFCIGRFQCRSEFEAAVKITGPVELTVGPQNGFRQAKVKLEYDGRSQNAVIYDRDLWIEFVEPLAEECGVVIETVRLPTRNRAGGRTRKMT